MKNENAMVKRNNFCHLSLEGEGGTQCRVRGKNNKVNLICTPSSALLASSPSRGKWTSSGFTLIELLVVVLIIGILAAVAVPQYQKAVMRSKFVNLKSLTRALAQADELYYLANDAYASSLEELDIMIPEGDSPSDQEYKKIYTWGQCWLSPSSLTIHCKNTQIDMGLIYYLTHSTDPHKGKYMCTAANADLTSPQNRICQQETHLLQPSYSDTNSAGWVY